RNRVFRIEQVARGGLTGIGISPRDILQPAVREGAAGIILVHNHPSGDPSPSSADHKLTRRIAEAAALLGISLLDHVIVAREGHLSII
ncbi:JAB domain-containing protein, partial [Acidimicrobium ferrooxidans]|nr:JAB domain-containing protein [Acidimicrobium ferrooxidans]